MKIGLNARFLTKPFTGIGQYTKNLFKELAKIDPGNEYIFVVPEELKDKNEFPKNVKIVVLKEKKLITAGIKKTWWEQIQVPEFFIKNKVDVAFFPYPSNPWTNDFYKKNVKTCLTIHDCIPWVNKKYKSGLLSMMYHYQSKKAAKKANIIFTVSKNSKEEIEKICGVDSKKIHVVYNDASDVYKQRIDEKFSQEILKTFGLVTRKFFLYVGGYDERKNVEYLLKEYEKFAKKNKNIPLVLVGGKLFDNKLYSSLNIECKTQLGSVIKTGFLDEKSLAALYGQCLAFVSFSKHEGFNIPVIEAANCGAPLIISDINVHKEIAKDCAIFVDINDEGAGVKALNEMLNTGSFEKFSKKSAELAKKYSWKTSAQKIKDVLFSE